MTTNQNNPYPQKQNPYPTKPTKKSKKPLIITLSCILTALLITGGFFTWQLLTKNTPKPLPSTTTKTFISTGDDHSCAIIKTNDVYCWGHNSSGQLGNGKGGHGYSYNLSEVKVNLPEPATQITAGGWHTCAITKTSTHCWGNNENGQLGNGKGGQEDDKSLNPVKVNLPEPATQITAGERHVCAISKNNVPYCWGLNIDGQLGNIFNNHKNDKIITPVKIKTS